MSENSFSNSIKDILDGIAKENEENKAGALKGEGKTPALVFDDTPIQEKEVTPNVDFSVAVEREKPKEFFVPEKYEAPEAPQPKRKDNAPRVAATYVPRFTEVSEQYRFSSSMRSAFVRVDTKKQEAEEGRSAEEHIDPTSELDDKTSASAVEVNIGKTKEDELTTATKVFKFLENEPRPTETYVTAEPYFKPQAEECVAEEEDKQPSEPREYKIPDPVDMERSLAPIAAASVVAKTAVEEAGSDMGDKSGIEQKRREYKTQPERDVFKDGFLDSIMSVKVRFFASLGIALLLLFVETVFAFGVNLPKILNMIDLPGAMALLDLQFVIAFYLLALPETVSAFRMLLKKRATPELFLSVSFAVIILYTVVISVYSPQKYALFGLLFAAFAIGAIGGSYYKRVADFTAFKRIYQNSRKRKFCP